MDILVTPTNCFWPYVGNSITILDTLVHLIQNESTIIAMTKKIRNKTHYPKKSTGMAFFKKNMFFWTLVISTTITIYYHYTLIQSTIRNICMANKTSFHITFQKICLFFRFLVAFLGFFRQLKFCKNFGQWCCGV